ncbi:peptide chain release factor N(5)-glutamine methyltransferase [Mycobacterium sp.]|uniref:peptide chain release factor N(5)-glutamine methyltransferase n=1 Tax=Mycobacterium sp. TaxID=1785 RepID=UPI0025E768B7|nr:peptide chain release factor N(5)-glutamine methyltransferase [Mycobacterium sp.]
MKTRLRSAIDSATTLLAEAGIDSARYDAEELAAHLAGTERGRLAMLTAPDEAFFEHYRDSVAARSRRIPLQHLTGTAAFGPLTLTVGPGVFIPRPETEAILEWATAQQLSESALIVDLCTGSGALALGLARHWPSARVIGVDDSEDALGYARTNAAGTAVELLHADVTAAGVLSQFDGQVDLLVANPPYVPDGAELEPEVLEHDPSHAVFGGQDGMTVIAALVGVAARLLRPGGLFAVEHDDTTSASTVQSLTETAAFADVAPRFDLTGRPRFVTARRIGGGND